MIKNIIIIIVIVIVLLGIYYGSFLPLKKAQLYINAQIGLNNGIRSLDDFNNLFDPALDFYSPVGQDEIVTGYLRILMDLVGQQSDKKVIDVLVKQAETRMAPILEKEKGFNFSQSIYNLAAIYSIAAVKFNDDTYYQKGVEMFRLGLKHSPNRKMFLYGLFGLYQFKGDENGMNEIGEIILKYWPETKGINNNINIDNN